MSKERKKIMKKDRILNGRFIHSKMKDPPPINRLYFFLLGVHTQLTVSQMKDVREIVKKEMEGFDANMAEQIEKAEQQTNAV